MFSGEYTKSKNAFLLPCQFVYFSTACGLFLNVLLKVLVNASGFLYTWPSFCGIQPHSPPEIAKSAALPYLPLNPAAVIALFKASIPFFATAGGGIVAPLAEGYVVGFVDGAGAGAGAVVELPVVIGFPFPSVTVLPLPDVNVVACGSSLFGVGPSVASVDCDISFDDFATLSIEILSSSGESTGLLSSCGIPPRVPKIIGC